MKTLSKILLAPLLCAGLAVQFAASPAGQTQCSLGNQLLAPIDLVALTGDPSCCAVEEAWGYYWVYAFGSGQIYQCKYDPSAAQSPTFVLSARYDFSNNMPPTIPADMTADEAANRLYVGGANGAGYKFKYDPLTSALSFETRITPQFQESLQGLCYDPGSGLGYTKENTNALIEFKLTNGVVTNVLNAPGINAFGLAFDSVTGTIWATDDGRVPRITQIDPRTGIETQNSFVPNPDPLGLGQNSIFCGADVMAFDNGSTTCQAIAVVLFNSRPALMFYALGPPPPPPPFLSLDGFNAGQIATLAVSNATPFDKVFVALSLAGGGPIATSFGPVSLTPPILIFPGTIPTDANGNASLQFQTPNFPALPFWFQGIDLQSLILTNGISPIIG